MEDVLKTYEKTYSQDAVTQEVPATSDGLFGISDDYIEKYQSLDVRFIKNKAATFFFEAIGDYMAPLILPKDILIVDRSIVASHQHIIVGSLDGGEMFCKRFIKKNGIIFLQSENSKYTEYKVEQEMHLSVFGVVRSIVREFI
jgi:DNA polymerase V